MVDPKELGLLHILVQLPGQLLGRGVIMAERLLHHDPRGVRQPGVGEAFDHRREQERRDLEIKHRSPRAVDRLTHAGVGRRVGEIPLHIRKPRGETREDLRIDLLTGAENRLARTRDQLLHTPVVDGHTDNREAEQAALLQPVERSERHHLREIASDPKDHQHISMALAAAARTARRRHVPHRHVSTPLLVVSADARHQRPTSHHLIRVTMSGAAGSKLQLSG